MASLSNTASFSSVSFLASLASSSTIPSSSSGMLLSSADSPILSSAIPSSASRTPLAQSQQEHAEAVFIAPIIPSITAIPIPDLPIISRSPMVAAYYPDWAYDRFPPEKIDFGRFDWIDFAFAIPTEDLELAWDDAAKSPGILHRLVKAAHAAGKKVKLSIGGWTGSGHFSSAVHDEQSRAKFAKSLVDAYKEFELDGLDIDWEYPGREGASGNKVDPNDSKNLLAFLQLLRQELPKEAKITAATLPSTFAGEDGEPMVDVSEFAKVLDWVLLMNYDVWGVSDKPGPNAPLFNGCGNSTQPEANAVSAFNAWHEAGFDASQLVLGIPSYGYVSDSKEDHLRTRHVAASRFFPPRAESVRVHAADGTQGQVSFRELVKQGALEKNKEGYQSAGGFERHWDACSGTPFLRSKEEEQMISYDDIESLEMKAKFVRDTGMLGVNMFSIDGDTDEWELTDAVRNALAL